MGSILLMKNNQNFKYRKTKISRVKIRFITPPPPKLYFLSAICFSDVFSDYKTFFFYGVSRGNA